MDVNKILGIIHNHDGDAVDLAKSLGGALEMRRAKKAKERAGGQELPPSKYMPNVPRQVHADGGWVEHYEFGGTVEAPQKTVKAYKLFRKKGDNIYPLFVDANTPVPMNQWIAAKAGDPGKDPKKVKSKLGDLAYRPGWHAGDLPIATHIGGKSDPKLKKPDYRPDEQVWAEVEMPNDVDWQSVANERAQKDKSGNIKPVTAHITDQVPHGGHYRYKTNPNMTGNWLIGGSMKVNRILDDEEVRAINSANGVADLPRLKNMRNGGSVYHMAEGGEIAAPPAAMHEPHRRAEEQGYSIKGYHVTRGTRAGAISSAKRFDPSRAQMPGEEATFFWDNPEAANKWAHYTAGTSTFEPSEMSEGQMDRAERHQTAVMPVRIDPGKHLVIDWPQETGQDEYSNKHMSKIITDARSKGYDTVRIKNMVEQGPLTVEEFEKGMATGYYPQPHDQIAVLNPAMIRSEFAEFDPEKKGRDDIGAAHGGAIDHMAFGGFEGPAPIGHNQPLESTFEGENKPHVIVSPRPGKVGSIPEQGIDPSIRQDSDLETWHPSTPNLVGAPTPPPVQHPVFNEPRMKKLTDHTQKIFKSSGFKQLIKDHTGLENLEVTPTVGTWKNEMEPSFIISHPDMTDEHAHKIANLMGFGYQQDATVQGKHNPDIEDGIPSLLIGKNKKLSAADIDRIHEHAKNEGLDFSVTKDGKAAKFLHFGGEEEYPDFLDKVSRVANNAKMPERLHARTSGDLINAKDYLNGIFGGPSSEEGLQASSERSPDLFRRVVDHVLAPYAKAVAGEGYRLSPERLAQTYGLNDEEQDYVRNALYPKSKDDRTTIPLMTGEEQLDVRPTGHRGTATVGDVLYALQNRAAQKGQIDPGDFSDEAKKRISDMIAKEVAYHVQNSDKSAIGWYDAALKKAMSQYATIFPELATDKDRELLFHAILGITSQGNDVYNNSVHAARLYNLVRNGDNDLVDAVKQLSGSFGDKTDAIEQNLLKLNHLINKNGFDEMREKFNKKMTVSQWNKELKKNPDLFGPNGKPLSMQGGKDQKVTGWTVFGPKIGSFINNLHGDYSTLTADLWFSRTWNRMLGHNFIHSPLAEQKQYQDLKDAMYAEWVHHNGFPFEQKQPMKSAKEPWEYGNDLKGMSREDFDNLVNDPEKMLQFAQGAEENYRKGQYKEKSDVKRRSKNWIENRELPQAAPRGDAERAFQQDTVEDAQKLLKKKYGLDISVADIQAALWFHEKELFGKFGVASEKAKPADYEDAANHTMDLINNNKLYEVKSKEKAKAKTKKAYGGSIDISHALEIARRAGNNGDTILAHINPQEAALLKRMGGSGTINPKTGLPQFGVDDGPEAGSTGSAAGNSYGGGYSANGGQDSPSESSGGPGGTSGWSGGNGGGNSSTSSGNGNDNGNYLTGPRGISGSSGLSGNDVGTIGIGSLAGFMRPEVPASFGYTDDGQASDAQLAKAFAASSYPALDGMTGTQLAKDYIASATANSPLADPFVSTSDPERNRVSLPPESPTIQVPNDMTNKQIAAMFQTQPVAETTATTPVQAAAEVAPSLSDIMGTTPQGNYLFSGMDLTTQQVPNTYTVDPNSIVQQVRAENPGYTEFMYGKNTPENNAKLQADIIGGLGGYGLKFSGNTLTGDINQPSVQDMLKTAGVAQSSFKPVTQTNAETNWGAPANMASYAVGDVAPQGFADVYGVSPSTQSSMPARPITPTPSSAYSQNFEQPSRPITPTPSTAYAQNFEQPSRPISQTPSTAYAQPQQQPQTPAYSSSLQPQQTIRQNFEQAFADARRSGADTFYWTNPATGKMMLYTTQLARAAGGRTPDDRESMIRRALEVAFRYGS